VTDTEALTFFSATSHLWTFSFFYTPGFGHHFYATVAGGSSGAGAAPVLLSTASGTSDGVLWCFLDFDPSAQPEAK
jgi:hypothetical protein